MYVRLTTNESEPVNEVRRFMSLSDMSAGSRGWTRPVDSVGAAVNKISPMP